MVEDLHADGIFAGDDLIENLAGAHLDHRGALLGQRLEIIHPSLLTHAAEHEAYEAPYANTKEDYDRAVSKIEGAFRKLDDALTRRSEGPFFNGADYSLVDAAYAPFLQRYSFLDRIAPLGVLERFANLSAWSGALMARASTHSLSPDVFEGMYRATVRKRGVWLSQFC
jgi:glutathione S-transferase